MQFTCVLNIIMSKKKDPFFSTRRMKKMFTENIFYQFKKND